MRKFLIFLLLAGFVGYVGYRYFTDENKPANSRRSAAALVAVETDTVKTADLSNKVIFTGSIRSEERYDASPKIAGIVKQINFNVGDTVRRGDVLAVLDDDEYRLAVEQAAASLLVSDANANDAERQLEIAHRDYDRAVNLHGSSVISSQELDRSEAAFQAAQAKHETALAQIRLSEAAFRSAQVRLGYTRITADWNGSSDQRVVGQRFVDAGGIVAANNPVLSILDINNVRAIVSVSEKEYPKMKIGGVVTVTTDAFPGRQFLGRVARIPQELGALTREAEVEVLINNVDLALKPGMFIRAEVEFARHADVAAAPVEAVVRRDDGRRGVYVLSDSRDRVTFKEVTEGIVDSGWVELVRGGDLLGSEVVTMGQHLLKDNIAVRVAGDTPPPPGNDRYGKALSSGGGNPGPAAGQRPDNVPEVVADARPIREQRESRNGAQ